MNDRFKTKPYEHQLRCLNNYGRRRWYALNSEQGTGKTFIIVNEMADLWANGDIDIALVIAPNGVHTNWTRIEIPKHMPDWVRHKAYAWNGMNSKREERAFEEFIHSDTTVLRIFCINWESLVHKKSQECIKRFLNTGIKPYVVGDETLRIKNPSSGSYKFLMKAIRPHTVPNGFRRSMCGTPITQAPFDAFAQYSWLSPQILGTTSFFAFKAEYADMIGKEDKRIKRIMEKTGSSRVPQIVERNSDGTPRYKNLDKLEKLIAPHTFRVLKAECLDLPKKIYKSAFFKMTAVQERAYEKMRDECRIQLGQDDTPVARLAALVKLCQITSGYVIHPANPDLPVWLVPPEENPKIELLVDRLKENIEHGKKTIVWARFHAELDVLAQVFNKEGISFVEYHGRVKDSQRAENIDSFQAGNHDVFLGQQQSGGIGITLTAASRMIYFSNDFNLGTRLQSEDRAHRIGQEEDVVYTNLICQNTVDEIIIKALMNKKDIADIVNGDIVREALIWAKQTGAQ